MKRLLSILSHPLVILGLVLTCDQVFKIWIKTNMYLGQEFPVFGNWFLIHFTENNGMAFGFEFGADAGKLFLSVFRVIAIGGIVWYLVRIVRRKSPRGVIVCISLILAGAIGNMIDSAFYGMLFNDSFNRVASFLPADGGYAPLLFGKVVDMLYFPLIDGFLPSWVPFWGGDYFVFFRPVFNIADSSITIGVIILLLFHRNFFRDEKEGEEKPAVTA